MQGYDLVAHLLRQRAFSRATFGPGMRTKGVVDHIRKELIEIEGKPDDVEEWVDLVLLALDGLWRCADHRAHPMAIEMAVAAIVAKQNKNERRDWPDWRTADPDKAIEHVKIAGTLNGAPVRPGCPYVGCPTPYLCRNGCKVSSSERVHLAEDVGGGP